jgi:multicomponent Na+:H+ antiporter subunit A
VILASLVIVFGLFPNLLSYSIIDPAMVSILPSVVGPNGQFVVHITHWHGFSTELFMTIGVIITGTLLVITLKRWGRLYDYLPQKLTLNKLYDSAIIGMEQGFKRVITMHMSGFSRDYLVYILGFFIILLGGGMFATNAFEFNPQDTSPIAYYEWILALVLAGSAIAVLFASTRLSAIILTGVIGYVVALFFVLFRAPDLALTQLIIETVSVSLFLLCFYHLPKLKKEFYQLRFRAGNLLISVGVGLIITFIALSAHGTRPFDSISEYYIKNSYKEGGGDNMVNVILVDFRGFDTLLEIVVLGIASFAIFSLVKLRMEEPALPAKGERD